MTSEFTKLLKSSIRVLQAAILKLSNDNFLRFSESGGSALVIANGPGLSKDVGKIEALIEREVSSLRLYAVNNFPTSEYFLKWKPSNLILADHSFWAENSTGDFAQARTDLLNALSSTARNFPVRVFLPAQARNSMFVRKSLMSIDNVSVCFFNTYTWPIRLLRNALYRYNLASPLPQNVVIAAMYIALLSGSRKLFLFGAEQSFHLGTRLREDNVLCFKYRRFYSSEKEIPFYKDPQQTSVFNVKEFFEVMVVTFESFYQIRDFSISIGARIFNLSTDTFIDCFDRSES